MEILNIKDFSFKYPSENENTLTDVSLSVNSGEFITICGKSGSGKSTLLRNIKPSIAPHGKTSGEILFNGKDINSLNLREQSSEIGFVSQSPDNQIVCDKVWHELAFGLESLGFSSSEIRLKVSEMASFFGIQTLFHNKTSELSGGQKQLLSLASVMVMQPSLLILDEPTAQLDPIAAQEFLAMLSRINRELGTTIVLSEHRLEDAFPYSDKIVVMEQGKVFAAVPPAEIGNILKRNNNDMFFAMPAPIQVFSINSEKTPVTVCDGRVLLKEKFKNYKHIPEIQDISPPCSLKKSIALELKEIFFRYEKNLSDVLKGVSEKIYEGEFYALLGGNGTGKSTLLSAIAGILKPQRGKIAITKKVVMLPQNPQTLFVKNTVKLDLLEMLSDKKISLAEKEKNISDISELCEITALLDKHPYDISGGEQQRAAFAKILLLKPEILLLDEPTKGLDAHFKKKLADIIISLKKAGTTVVMVSHDIEFCARYADRLGMFFDGKIISSAKPRSFFSSKCFYTTSAFRMSRGIIKNAILTDDIIKILYENEVEIK